jgi:hypothetical protein
VSWAVLLLLAATPSEPDVGRIYIRDGGAKLPLALPGLPFVWELPPKTVQEIPIDGTTRVGGIPVRLRQLIVRGKPEEIGRHFLESFLRQGLYIAPRQAIDRLLTGVDPQSIVTYSVVLQVNDKDHTTVILGESRPLDRQRVEGLPVLPQSKGAIPVQFEGHLLLTYLAPVSEADARAFYVKELAARGYQAREPGVWTKPGDRVEVTLSQDSGQTKVVVRQTRLP